MDEYGTDRPDGGDDARLDAELAAAGAELRRSAPPVEGNEVIAHVLRRDVTRARRANVLLAAAAAIAVVAMVPLAARSSGPVRGSGGAESAAGGGGPTPAEQIVAELPDEPVDPREVQLVASVSRYDTCDSLLEQLHRVGAAHVGSRGFGGTTWIEPLAGDWDRAAGFAAAGARADEGGDGGGGGGETLGTNVIVEGVDEPDSVKATGTLVVELAGTALRVVDTAVPAVVGTLELGERGHPEERFAVPTALLVEGRRVVVFGTESVAAEPVPGDPSATRPWHEYLTVTLVDLSDPAAPEVTERVRIEGRLVAVRRVGDEVRMVTASSLADLPMVRPTTPSSVGAALHQNRLAVAASAIEDWIPEWDRGEGTDATPLVGCDGVVVPDTFAGVHMTSLVEFDLEGEFAPRATSLLAPSEQLTATATDVVIASQVWVDPIDRKDDFSDWSTALHHFRFGDGAAAPSYLASGAVDGSIRDDFSIAVLDDGTVGAVTVDVLPWQSREKADVTVRLLAAPEGGTTLEQVGALLPEGSGAQVAGVRFMGDRLLLSSGWGGNRVAAVDLSDRTAPRDLGTVALKGPGAYFHSVGEHRVLAIGATMRREGETIRTGFHASLLDLSGAPAVVGMWEMDDLGSMASYDHHAFTWWARRNLAAFGVTHQSRDTTPPPPPDAAFLRVDGDSVDVRLVTPREADLGPKCRFGERPVNCDHTGPPQVQRVMVVDGQLWLYTSESLERLDAETYESQAIVPLRPRLF